MSFCIYDFYSRVFERISDAAFQLTYNIIFMRERSVEIEIRFFAGNSEFFGIECLPENLRAVEHGFRRYAASVQAHSAELVFFYERRFQSALCGCYRRAVSGGSAADNGKVKDIHRRSFRFFSIISEICPAVNRTLCFLLTLKAVSIKIIVV